MATDRQRRRAPSRPYVVPEGGRRPTARSCSTTTSPRRPGVRRRRGRVRAEHPARRGHRWHRGQAPTSAATRCSARRARPTNVPTRGSSAAARPSSPLRCGSATSTGNVGRRRVRWRLGGAGVPGVHEPGARRSARPSALPPGPGCARAGPNGSNPDGGRCGGPARLRSRSHLPRCRYHAQPTAPQLPRRPTGPAAPAPTPRARRRRTRTCQ